ILSVSSRDSLRSFRDSPRSFRDSLPSFRQTSHIVEIVPAVETRRVPAEISVRISLDESPLMGLNNPASSTIQMNNDSRAMVTEGKSASTQSAILPHRMSVPQVHYPSTCTAN